jgi:hypothetical protein
MRNAAGLMAGVWALLLVLLACGAQPLFAAEVVLTKDGKSLLPVVVGEKASDVTRKVADELAAYLGRMSGTTLEVKVGDGTGRGIFLGRPTDFTRLTAAASFKEGPFNREQYLLRSAVGSLHVIGATDLAVSHAAWDLLHRLGYRQYFPGEKWEIVPRSRRLAIDVNEMQSPSFYARRIWYNWGTRWGYNEAPYQQWSRRNRAVMGFNLSSGHAYEEIIRANLKEFEAHPEYLALVGGKRQPHDSPDVKLCVSNANLRALVVRHAKRYFDDRPDADSISMEPSDGYGWCECEKCAAIGGPSNLALTLANDVAAALNKPGQPPHYVGMLAYNQHSIPPTLAAHPNVIVSVATAYLHGELSFDQIVAGWKAKGATVGIYDYLSISAWDFNQPRRMKAAYPADIAESLSKFHTQGARFVDNEAGDCWGPAGLGYYVASRVMWDVKEAKNVQAITDRFLADCFGSACEPMREFYRLISFDKSRRPATDLVGRMYRQLDAARHATTDPAVLARLDDLTLYTRYAELYAAYAAAGDEAAKQSALEATMRQAYRMRESMMVHSYGLWCHMVSQPAAFQEDHPWKTGGPFTAAEIAGFITEGVRNNPITDPGFTAVPFSRNLVPAAERLLFPSLPGGYYPQQPQGRQSYYIWVPQGTNVVELKINVRKIWANRMPKVTLNSMQGGTAHEVASDSNYRPDNQEHVARLATPHAGLHRVDFVDGGDVTTVRWPEGMPVTVESSDDSPVVSDQFLAAWTMYFYVPRGTKSVGGWASRSQGWCGRISGRLHDADGIVVLDFSKVEEGWFNVSVAAGQDGRLWKFDESSGLRLLMTVPPYLARTPAELMLPAEVVEKDAKR